MLQKIYSQLREWSVVLLVAALAFFFYPVAGGLMHGKIAGLAVFSFLGLLVLALGAFLWRRSSHTGSRITAQGGWIIAAAWLLPLVYTISALLTSAHVRSFVGTGTESTTVAAIALFVACFTVAVFSSQSWAQIRRTVIAFMSIAALVAAYELLKLVTGATALSLGGALPSPSGTLFGSAHDFAAFLGFALLIALVGVSYPGKWIGLRGVSLATIVLGLPILVIANSFDVWVSIAVAALATAAVIWMRILPASMGLTARLYRVAPLLAVSLFSVVCLLYGSSIIAALPTSAQLTEVDVRPSWNGTLTIAQGVYSHGHAPFGTGPNTFSRTWGFYKPLNTNDTIFWDVDFPSAVGYIPTTAIEVGFIGILVWALFLALFALQSLSSLWNVSSQKLEESIAGGQGGQQSGIYLAASLMAALTIGALYLWAMHFVYTPGLALTALAFIVTGLTIASWAATARHIDAHTQTPNEGSQSLLRFVPAVGLLGAAAISGFFGVWMLKAVDGDLLIKQSVAHYNQTQDIQGTVLMLDQAGSIAPQADAVHRANSELALVALSRITAQNATTTEAQAALTQAVKDGALVALNEAKAATVFDPEEYKNWLSLAQVYEALATAGAQGAAEQARQAYLQVAQNRPQNPFPYLRLAVLATSNSDAAGARGYLSQAINLKPSYAPAHFLDSQVSLAIGSTTDALNSAVAAAQYAPQDPSAWFWLGALLTRGGDDKDAVIALEKAVSLYPDYSNALYLLGISYSRLGRTDDTLRTFEHLQKLNPTNPDVAVILDNIRSGKPPLTAPTAPTQQKVATPPQHK